MHQSFYWIFVFVNLPSLCSPHILTCSLPVSGGVTTAHQVPAVSQSAYSPPTPETPDSILSTPPQTLLSKSLPPSLQTEQSLPSITGLPPTQPTTKVIVLLYILYLWSQNMTILNRVDEGHRPNTLLWLTLSIIFSSTTEKRCEEESRHHHPNHCCHAHHEHHGRQRHQPGDGRRAWLPAHTHFSGGGPQLQHGDEPRPQPGHGHGDEHGYEYGYGLWNGHDGYQSSRGEQERSEWTTHQAPQEGFTRFHGATTSAPQQAKPPAALLQWGPEGAAVKEARSVRLAVLQACWCLNTWSSWLPWHH